ncbi:hypothetical protein ACOMHN_041175 [Nucella lapillus]
MPQHDQRHEQIQDLSTETVMKKATTADVAVMVDCGSLCRKHLGVEIPGLGHVWFVHDVCGQVCTVITWLLLIFAEIVVMVVVVPQIIYPYNIINAVAYNFFAFLALAAHIRVTLTDPGAVPKGNATGETIQSLGLKEGELYICMICVHAFCMGFAHFISCFSTPKDDWMGYTAGEIKMRSRSSCLVITTGPVIKPTIEDYWSQEDIAYTLLSLVWFQAILSNFHVTDNTEDDGSHPLYKVRLFFRHLRQQFTDMSTPQQDISFDEVTCPWKGRMRFRLYNPAKPDKFGIKLYEACEAKTGHVLAMDIYQGSMPATEVSKALDIDEGLSVTTRVVLGLLAFGGLLDKGHQIFMDNCYTSPEPFTQLYLFNTYA